MSTDATYPTIPAVGLRSRFQRGIVYNTIGAVFNQGSTFAVNIVVANLLGRQVFGEYAMVQRTLVTLGFIAQVAAPYTLTKYVAEYRSTDQRRAGLIIGLVCSASALLAGLAAIALVVLAGWLAGSVLKVPEIHLALALGSLVLLFAVFNGLLMAVLSGLESYRRLAEALTWSGVVYLGACSLLAWRAGLNGAIAGQALGGVVQFVLLFIAAQRECRQQGIEVSWRGATKEFPVLLGFTLPGALSGFTSMAALWLASAFLVRQVNGYSQMALYSAAFSLVGAILFLPNLTNSVGMSLINHHKGMGRESDYRRTFWSNLGISATIVILGSMGAALFGPAILRLFGKDFREGYPVLLILLVATMAQGLALAAVQIIQSQARMWSSFFGYALPRDLLVVGLAYVLIPTHGAKGLATAYALGWIAGVAGVVLLASRIGLSTVAADVFAGGVPTPESLES